MLASEVKLRYHSAMTKHNQDGAVSGLGLSFGLTVVLLIAAIVFGAWAYSSRQDYKNNVDAKINAAVQVAKQQESNAKDQQFAQEEKNPLKTYNGPEAFGSLAVAYPKTWSGYVVASDSGSNSPMDGYFYPGVVPSVSDQGSVYALRISVLGQSYSQTIQNLSSLQTSANAPTVTPYALPKVPQTVGVKVTGTLPVSNQRSGTMVILPLRSQTLEIWTEGDQFASDFNNIILPNFSFSP